MSQITKALELAKADRACSNILEDPENGSFPLPGKAKTGAPARAGAAIAAPVDFEFTETRVVEVSVETWLKNRIVVMDPVGSAEAERFNHLRTQVFQRTRPKGWNTVQVTSFGTGEGKSTVAVNLAVSIARDTRQTTLLVELDFRRPSLARLLGLGPECRGLKSYFLEDAPLEELFVSPGVKKLAVLPAGGVVENPAELLGSPKMEALVREVKRRYCDRFIIFDTPGVSLCPDPLIVADYVDSVIMVARPGRTTKESIRAAAEKISKEKFLGVLLNDTLE